MNIFAIVGKAAANIIGKLAVAKNHYLNHFQSKAKLQQNVN